MSTTYVIYRAWANALRESFWTGDFYFDGRPILTTSSAKARHFKTADEAYTEAAMHTVLGYFRVGRRMIDSGKRRRAA